MVGGQTGADMERVDQLKKVLKLEYVDMEPGITVMSFIYKKSAYNMTFTVIRIYIKDKDFDILMICKIYSNIVKGMNMLKIYKKNLSVLVLPFQKFSD